MMVLNRLVPSLEDLFKYCGRHLQLKTVLVLADQLLGCLTYIHTKSHIHHDVKSDNFLTLRGPPRQRLPQTPIQGPTGHHSEH